MKRWVVLIALVLGALWLPMAAAVAADDGKISNIKSSVVTMWRYNAHPEGLPYPRSERSQSVWASGGCWSECGSYCAWGMAGCLQRDAQGQCIKLTDKCDRYCQRECRTSGGPFLPIEFPWE
jgi:hypothetical protein